MQSNKTVFIQDCFHGDRNQHCDAYRKCSLSGSGWWGIEQHNEQSSTCRKTSEVRCGSACGHQNLWGTGPQKRTMHHRRSALTPPPTPHHGPCTLLPSWNASRRCLFEETLAYFSRVLVLCGYGTVAIHYSPRLGLRRIGWPKGKTKHIWPSPLSSHTRHNLPTKNEEEKARKQRAEKSKCMHIKKQELIPDDQTSYVENDTVIKICLILS